MTYINISGYRFIHLENLDALQHELKVHCVNLSLKGTILLSSEGINLFLCGIRQHIDAFYALLETMYLLTIDFKESCSKEIPFKTLLVKLKREIIPFGIPSISPENKPAPRISAEKLKQWLDEGKPMILLDTRNQYEITWGTFNQAIQLNIAHFRDFPQALSHLPETAKQLPIITFCTGGIRCEKAAPYLIEEGYPEVYQLDGGILKYLEKCGAAHFEGECFVFDNRIAVNSSLEETVNPEKNVIM